MMRRLIKQLFAAALYYSGLLALIDWLATIVTRKEHAVLLMYHRVLDDPFAENEYAQTGTAVSTEAFAEQMAYLSKRNEVITASDYVDRLRTGQPIPKKCTVVTFDDGWRDNYENAFPILKKLGIPATIFVCTDFVGTTRKFWFQEILHSIGWQELSSQQLADALKQIVPEMEKSAAEYLTIPDRLARDVLIDRFFQLAKSLNAEQLEQLASALSQVSAKIDAQWSQRRFILDWDEIAAMDRELIEIGSHGRSHRLLTSISTEEAEIELTESRATLETKLGRKVGIFAYPNGTYDETIKELASKAGYRGAFAVGHVGSEVDFYSIPRIGVHEGAMAGYRGKFSVALWALMLSPTKLAWFSRHDGKEPTGH